MFTYSVNDGADGTALADAVDITVTPQNDSPVAADDVANGFEDLAGTSSSSTTTPTSTAI